MEKQEEETGDPIISLADGFPKLEGPMSPPSKDQCSQDHGTSGGTRLGNKLVSCDFLRNPYQTIAAGCGVFSVKREQCRLVLKTGRTVEGRGQDFPFYILSLHCS